jgi:cell division protein FtsB
MTKPSRTSTVKSLPYRRQRRSLWLSRALIFATVIVLVDAIVGKAGVAETIRAGREYEQAQARLWTLRAENAALLEQARRLAEDPAAIESRAREDLGFLRQGEIVFVVKPTEK